MVGSDTPGKTSSTAASSSSAVTCRSRWRRTRWMTEPLGRHALTPRAEQAGELGVEEVGCHLLGTLAYE